MDKAYDLKALGQKIADKGLPQLKDIGEVEAGVIYQATKEWLKESAALSENKVDDFVAPFIDQLDPFVLPQIDKINGRVG